MCVSSPLLYCSVVFDVFARRFEKVRLMVCLCSRECELERQQQWAAAEKQAADELRATCQAQEIQLQESLRELQTLGKSHVDTAHQLEQTSLQVSCCCPNPYTSTLCQMYRLQRPRHTRHNPGILRTCISLLLCST